MPLQIKSSSFHVQSLKNRICHFPKWQKILCQYKTNNNQCNSYPEQLISNLYMDLWTAIRTEHCSGYLLPFLSLIRLICKLNVSTFSALPNESKNSKAIYLIKINILICIRRQVTFYSCFFRRIYICEVFSLMRQKIKTLEPTDMKILLQSSEWTRTSNLISNTWHDGSAGCSMNTMVSYCFLY
jgi:hypothetical protein